MPIVRARIHDGAYARGPVAMEDGLAMVVAAMDLDPAQSVTNRRAIRVHAMPHRHVPSSALHIMPNPVTGHAGIVASAVVAAMFPASAKHEAEVCLMTIDADRSATQRAVWLARRPHRIAALTRRLRALGLDNAADVSEAAPEAKVGPPTGYVETIAHEAHPDDVDLAAALARLYAGDPA